MNIIHGNSHAKNHVIAHDSQTGSASPSQNTAATLYTRHGSTKTISDVVQCEGALTIRVDGRTVCTLSCSADHPSELVVGHLFAEGLIASYDDILGITVDNSAHIADVSIAGRAKAPAPASDDAFFITTSSARLMKTSLEPAPLRGDAAWAASWIFDIACEFAKDKTSHARTRGCHSAYLAQSGTIMVMREDVGRHNAVDKVIGWALINGIDLATCILYTSGRVPTDMVSKAIRSHIPVLASKSVTTDKAAALARRSGLVLLCEALPDSFELISGNDPQPEAAFAKAI